ncbi:unnamed protein product [Cuscuta epithymum]|uniref:HMA domain-containing protein n=1 Tax=Cuscuta epithymum TaxID=186058 RepID=A0AAV0CAK0_9ASTE|nr:unnamed protein product [Cuscuta epithymum]
MKALERLLVCFSPASTDICPSTAHSGTDRRRRVHRLGHPLPKSRHSTSKSSPLANRPFESRRKSSSDVPDNRRSTATTTTPASGSPFIDLLAEHSSNARTALLKRHNSADHSTAYSGSWPSRTRPDESPGEKPLSLANYLDGHSTHNYYTSSTTTPYRNHQVVELRVSLHCKGCERKVRKHLSTMEGVKSFSIDSVSKKVIVIGDVSPLGVLASISKVKSAELWR